jgi:hypothetical protein
MSKKAESKVQQVPPPQAGGIPLPPGYVSEPTSFSSPGGAEITRRATEKVAKSITYTPLISSFMSAIMLFFMGSSVMMFVNSASTLFNSGLNAVTTALGGNHRLTFNDRLTLIAIGLGLFVFVAWRTNAAGLFGKPVVDVPPERPPLFLEIF